MEIWDFLVYWTVKTVTSDNENGEKNRENWEMGPCTALSFVIILLKFIFKFNY